MISRRHNVHVMVFFIILVANVGGALSPLGDPPLFIGFLNGVDFFWTTKNLWIQTAIVAGVCCWRCSSLFDLWRFRSEPIDAIASNHRSRFEFAALVNHRADRRHHRLHSAVGELAAGCRGRCFRHQAGTAEPGARRAAGRDRIAVVVAGRRTSIARRTGSPGSRSGRWPSCSPPSSSSSFRCWPCSMPARGAFSPGFCSGGDAKRRHAARGRLFLVHRADVGVPRQCADLSVVLQARGRRCAAS